MNIRLSLDESDLVRLGFLFDRMERIGERLEPKMGKAADRIRLGFQRNFESESGGGEPWDDLAPRTTAERGRLRQEHGWPITPEHPILRRSGELRQSVIQKGHPLHVCEVDADSSGITVELGSVDPRFEILHAGGVNEEGFYVPASPMTVLSDADVEGLRRALEWIAGELAQGGF